MKILKNNYQQSPHWQHKQPHEVLGGIWGTDSQIKNLHNPEAILRQIG